MCLLKDKGVLELLRKHGIDPEHIARCIELLCRRRRDLLEKDPMQALRAVVKDERALEIITNAMREFNASEEHH